MINYGCDEPWYISPADTFVIVAAHVSLQCASRSFKEVYGYQFFISTRGSLEYKLACCFYITVEWEWEPLTTNSLTRHVEWLANLNTCFLSHQTQRSQQWVFVTGTANGKGCDRRGGVTVCTARMARSPNDDKESAELIITENTTG
ncbi:hypothetical protein J6590_098272 [Homalodisca vitripennis]|nr:hypothetical protein J6590_098272 [Homalodisca vitripennis]